MQGQLEISSTLAREAGVDELAEQREPFLEVLMLLMKTIIAVVGWSHVMAIQPTPCPTWAGHGRHDEDEMRLDLKPVNRNVMGISSTM